MITSYNQFMQYKSNRIMVVDDEEFCQASMKAILFKAGIDIKKQVDCFIDGQEALDQIKWAHS